MIRNYTLNNTLFHTITVPKGTLLFRGINFENESDYLSIFNDFIGYKTNKYYGIDPNMNVFFYPAPYISDSVKIYDIHTMYITQYDTELLLLIKPSDISRENKESSIYNHIITTCINLSKENKCGQDMSQTDPCFTDLLLKRFPQIDGYIAIAEQDAHLFTKKYKDLIVKYDNINKAKQIILSILSNVRGVTGIPEIVLHPLRFRYDNCHLITENFYSPEKIVKYCIHNRSQYNFFPLLYITNNNIFRLTELMNKQNITKLAKSVRIFDENTGPKIYENINMVFGQMLDHGYKINETIFRAMVDKRTGFYKVYLDSPNKTNKRFTQKKIFRNFKDDGFDGYIDSYIIKPHNDKLSNTIVSSHKTYINDFLNDLVANNYSAKKKLVLNRGNKEKFIYNYYIDKVLERPDLSEYKHLRRRKQNFTNKKINNYFSSILQVDGFDLSNLDDIENIPSVNKYKV
jgi:hypothetical protein